MKTASKVSSSSGVAELSYHQALLGFLPTEFHGGMLFGYRPLHVGDDYSPRLSYPQ